MPEFYGVQKETAGPTPTMIRVIRICRKCGARILADVNAQNVFTGWTIIAGETTVDATGNAFMGSSGTVQVYDPNGVLLSTMC